MAQASDTWEILCWTAIPVSNALGTSSGDWLADDTGLGFRGAFAVNSAVLVPILAVHYLTTVNSTLLFWLAFILTRPLGAVGGDALTSRPRRAGSAGAPPEPPWPC